MVLKCQSNGPNQNVLLLPPLPQMIMMMMMLISSSQFVSPCPMQREQMQACVPMQLALRYLHLTLRSSASFSLADTT
jgi:hypothetical protein